MKVEIRGNSVHIEGYVNAVERDSRQLPSPRGKFVEKVRSKTFQKALERNPSVDLLFNHNEQRKLGNTTDGTLNLHEDEIGLRASAIISDPEVVQKAKDKRLTGWSFGFTKIKDSWSDGEDGIQRRTLEDIRLLEVSILDVTPAYIATSVEVRDDEQELIEHRQFGEVEYGEVQEERQEEQQEDEQRELVVDYSLYRKKIELAKLRLSK